MSTTSRRAVLAGAATLPALAVSAFAVAAAKPTEPDPILALVERARQAGERWQHRAD